MPSFELPFTLDVEFTAYQYRAHVLGVLKSNMANYDKWLCNNLVNSWYRSKLVYATEFDALHKDLWCGQEGLLSVQEMYLAPYAFEKEGLDIVEFNKSMLQRGYYVFGTYNEFYIPHKPAYGKYDFNSDYLIFGYDDEAQVFKSSAQLDDGIYSRYDLSYENYVKSLVGNISQTVALCYRKPVTEYNKDIDAAHIANELEDYLCSRTTSQGVTPDEMYGICVWDRFAQYVQDVAQGNIDFDVRYGQVYFEYRQIMQQRIEALFRTGYIQDDTLPIRYNESIVSPAKKVLEFSKNFVLRHNGADLEQILKLIDDVRVQEQLILPELLKELRHT